MLGWQTAFQRFKTATNNYNLGISSSTTQHRNLVPSKVKMPYKQGVRRSVSTSRRKLTGRLATQRNVLSNVAQSLCPIVRIEENFVAPQFIPDSAVEFEAGTAGGFAPPLVSGSNGTVLHQNVQTGSTANFYDSTILYPHNNSGIGSQLVQWQSSYLKTEQDLLMASAFKAQNTYTNVLDLPQNYLGLTGTALVNSKGIPAKDFVYRGGVTTHTYINSGNTQCKLTFIEFTPRRMGNITPQAAWDYDVQIAATGLINAGAAPANLAVGVAQSLRSPTKSGMRPGQLKGGMFNYWFKRISTKVVHMEPGEELKYKQVYPPWVDRAKMRDIYLSSFSAASGTVTAAAAPEILYNSHSRFLLVIGIGEHVKVSGAGVEATSFQTAPGSWACNHSQMRRSSIQCLLPSRRTQIAIIDTPRILTVAGGTFTDFNEEQDISHTVTI